MLQKIKWMGLALVCLPAAAQGQERYELKPRFTAGQRWSERRVNTFEMTTTVKAQQQVVEQNRQETRQTLEFEWEALEVADNVPTAARVQFGPNCGGEVEENGQRQTIRFSAAGKTIEARRRPDGEVDIKPADANVPEVLAILEDLFEPDLGAFPKKALAVGESWSWEKQSVANAFGLGEDDEGSITCTIKSVSTKNSRKMAEITVRVQLKVGAAQQGGGQRIATLTESNLEGCGLMDIAAGRMVELDLSGNVVVGGIISAPDENGNVTPQADLDGVGRMTLELRSRLLGEKKPDGPRQAVKADSPEFAGEYANTEMNLTLRQEADGYKGELSFGERKFPVRAKADGDTLKGAFQSEENWFDFTAKFDGITLSLTTGGKTHVLKKKITPKNPLGGSPSEKTPPKKEEPANPLSSSATGIAEPIKPTQPPPSQKPNGTSAQAPATTDYSIYQCLDTQGFRDASGRPLEVFRMLMPQGWRFSGGLTWKVNHKGIYSMSRVDLVNPVELAFKVSSPDERVVIQAYPEVHFADLRGSPAYEMGGFPTGSNYGGFISCPTMDPATYITEFVIPRQRGGLQDAQIVESKSLPSVVQRYDREAAIVTGALQGAVGGGLSHQAALVVVDHIVRGLPCREAFVVALGYLHTPGITMWSSRLNLSMMAPRDEVDRWQPVIATMLNSIEFNMRWVGEVLKVKKQAEGVVIDVDNLCRKIDAEITANRSETNAQIQRDMYPRLAPFCDHTGADGKRYFLETDKQHQMNEQGQIRSALTLPDQEGWTRMPEYTGG
ncbi:MAG: hypothetical protein ABII12_08930 [Planctomycetota bacterium]